MSLVSCFFTWSQFIEMLKSLPKLTKFFNTSTAGIGVLLIAIYGLYCIMSV